MKKLVLFAAVAAGYVLGARAGRQRYETIKNTFVKVKNNPTVQEKAGQAYGAARDVAKEQAPIVADKVTTFASAAADKVKPGSGESVEDLADQLNPDSTVHQGDKAYPQGDLP